MNEGISHEEITALFYPPDEEPEWTYEDEVRSVLQDAINRSKRQVPTYGSMLAAYSALGGRIESRYLFISRVGEYPKDHDERFQFAVESIIRLLETEQQENHPATGEWPFRHGLKCAIQTQCRCDDCGPAWNKLKVCEQMVMVEGRPLQDAADELGITRERVRQILKIAYPHYKPGSARTERLQREQEKERQEYLESVKGECLMCGEAIYRKGGKTCGGQCSDDYIKLFRDISEERRRQHRVYTASWVLRNQDREDIQDRITNAKNVVRTEGRNVDSQGFWFIEGSAAMEAAIRLYKKGGKAFSMMPKEKQKQVKDYVNRQATEESPESDD